MMETALKTRKNLHDNKYVHTLLLWNEGVTMNSSINEETQRKLDNPLGIYVVTPGNTLNTTKSFKTSITRESLDQYGYALDFQARATKRNQKQRRQQIPKRPKPYRNSIGTYMISNSLTALGIKDVEKVMKRIKRITQTQRRTDKQQKPNEKRHTITDKDVLYTKKQLNGFIISELDKNTGQLYVS
jgi:hypothetical protein